ncbi:MAG: Phosphoenolpyruvate synthase/pyruvate phosphate dikinase [Parcubacteria group bacterium GW2011_GWA2_46_9]|nr:MAG: Phosphoenolpyruvate synthase/pyruvate phosphate dikinase [Parcubacteria group bacterium GW2011_GWA2_46_9]
MLPYFVLHYIMPIPAIVQKKVKGTTWYHQRFDGAPLYMVPVCEAEVMREARKPAGTEADVRVGFFTDGKADWYLDMRDVRRGARIVVERAKHDASISTKLLRAWRDDEHAFQKFFDNFSKVRLKMLSDSKLLSLAERWHTLFVRRVTSSAIIDHFALGTDMLIAKMLRAELGGTDKESDFTKIFSTVTAPAHQSFINKAEMELLKIAIKLPSSSKQLAKYQQRYFWLHNNYFRAQELSKKFFQREIERWQNSGANLLAKYKQLRDMPANNVRKKIQLLKKHKLSRHLRTLLKISEDFTWWQDERKRSTFLNIHLGSKILGEMARRRKYNPELMKYLMPFEIKLMFLKGSPSVEDLRKRQRGCVMVVWRGGYCVAIGRDIDRLRHLMFTAKTRDAVRDVRGLSASVGKAVGRVKIVGSVKEINKVNKGDILVAVMTRPDYIIGIKKAAAIVTNEGGITCHAAIVSRELGIPCIIGTKIATEVFKDGDLVEVNANHGVVKKISVHK